MGTVAAVLGLSQAHAGVHGYDLVRSSRFPWALVYAALMVGAGYAAGLPDLSRSRRSVLTAASASALAAAIGVSLLQLLVGAPLLPRFVVLGAPLPLLPLALLCAALARDGQVHDGQRARVAAVVSLDEGLILADELADRPERPAALVLTLSPESAVSTDPGVEPLVESVRASAANVLVLNRAAQSNPYVVAQAAVLHESGVRVRTLSLFYDEWLGKLPVGELERVSLMFDIGELHRARYGRAKRVLDSGLAALGLVALGLVTPVVLAGNRLGNRGPLLYRQDRVGRDGRPFRILKFRTMRPRPEGEGEADWTGEDDPRVTPFGAWLRRSHLDELPQVLNVLAGHLAIVGPRPEQGRYVSELEAKLPFYRLRHLVRPGLTGWAQVNHPYGASDGDALEKLQYEFWYLRHQSLALDLRIVGRTLRSVVGRSGR